MNLTDRQAGRCLTTAALLLLLVPALGRAQSPEGKTIAEVIPQGNRIVSTDQILAQLVRLRPGNVFKQQWANEDTYRLNSKRWFATIDVYTKPLPPADGRIQVYILVTEYPSVIQDILYVGAQHLKPTELDEITGLRRGTALNPAANYAAAQNILHKYQEQGRLFASVGLAEGGQANDRRVVFKITEGPVVKVRHISFTGQQTFSGERLRTQTMSSRALIGIGGDYNPAMIDADVSKLKEYYQGLGFQDVQVSAEPMLVDERTIDIIFHVNEGQRYRVKQVTVVGNKKFSEEKLLASARSRPGEFYSKTDVSSDTTVIRTLYGLQGQQVGVQPVVYQMGPGEVGLKYEVMERPPARVGEIRIVGNEVTQDRVIRRELGIYPGQVLQYPALQSAEARLARLGIFEVNPEQGVRPTVSVLDPDSDNPVKDVLVQVQEAPTGSFLLGLGVNSDAGLSGSIVLNERNFDITRFPTSLDDILAGRAFRGAGQEFRVEAVPGTEFQRYTMSWREPSLFDSPYSLGVSGYYYNRAFLEYTEDRYGGRVSLSRKLDQFWTATGSVRIEGVNVRDIPFFSPPQIADFAGGHFLLGLKGGVTRDTRDSFLRPTAGNLLDLSYEQVLGDYTFPLAVAEDTQFFTTYQRPDGSGRHVLALRSQLGVAGANAPVYERFYAGGFRSLRGFTFRGVGPFVNGYNIGGDFSWLNSIEYQIPILANDKLYTVAFLDSGTVENRVEFKDYRVTAGFGFRIVVPALGPVPIALDFGFPIVKGPDDNTQLFSFWLGFFN